MAENARTAQGADILQPFRLSRFAEFDLVGEKGAASVGH
jgi:sarcosine oxidase subunit beta